MRKLSLIERSARKRILEQVNDAESQPSGTAPFAIEGVDQVFSGNIRPVYRTK
ncbi:hypothetical protein [Bradyrhizobium nanningense]|uniref:hypothetical protein n=1 Tax=Bradyrhizobium nanningense TaxID=1325118 RepID=UPI0019D6BA43|nr:hypothetical protein [Bradyrhizobium nanningense]